MQERQRMKNIEDENRSAVPRAIEPRLGKLLRLGEQDCGAIVLCRCVVFATQRLSIVSLPRHLAISIKSAISQHTHTLNPLRI